MSYLAHTENINEKVHYLNDHLFSVGSLAEQFIRDANPELAEIARWSGLLHDLGKYRDEFQEYLRGNRKSSADTHHAVYGAALAFYKASESRNLGSAWILIAFAIAAHHAGLHDADQLRQLIINPVYDAKSRLETLIKRFEDEVENIVAEISAPVMIGQDKLKLELATRIVFSCLVDADFLDTEAHYNAIKRVSPPKFNPSILLEKLALVRIEKSQKAVEDGKNPELIKIRNQIYEQCLEKSKKKQGFFSLTVPTGGGKTLSAMAFGLQHAKIHNLKRIIVVIPYLSIIEQNAEEYRKILDPDNEGIVIENHSAIKIESELREELNLSEARVRSPLELAAENWDAPIVITTSVQFIESLFSNKTSRCRKLHNIAHSVVIFDEVQTLPAHILQPLFSFWRELVESYGVSFVFSSATQPAFKKQPNLSKGFTEGEMIEIIDDTENIFQKLQRVRYELPRHDETKTFSEIAEEMRAFRQVLCVVNTRKQAFELFEELTRETSAEDRKSAFHLSSAMCAEHRLDTITEIKQLLTDGKPCQVVSTQLIEAGVDIDFPILYRALSPLDSIVQAAGRCNREGRSEFGKVSIFIPAEHSLPKGIYSTATSITSSLITQFTENQLATEPQIFGDYFSQLFSLTQTGADIERERKELNFRTVAQSVKVIEDSGQPVIVPYGGENGSAMRVVHEVRGKNINSNIILFGRNDMRRLQRFIVNVQQHDFDKLQLRGQLTSLIPQKEGNDRKLDLWVLNIGSYNSDFGVLIDTYPSDEFIL